MLAVTYCIGDASQHLPFIFPARLLQHYPNQTVLPPTTQLPPEHMPAVAWSDSIELKEYADLKPMAWSGAPGSVLPPAKVQSLRQAYYSAVSHTDECLGQVMSALNASQYANNTVIAFWGDHGWCVTQPHCRFIILSVGCCSATTCT